MRKGNKSASKQTQKSVPPSVRAEKQLGQGPLKRLAREVIVHQDNSYPMARMDWGYVTSKGHIYLNPNRDATMGEWEYVLAHCMLHLGLGQFREDRIHDPLWVRACDLVVTRFLRDSWIGTPPPEFCGELPLPAKDEEATWEQLRLLPEEQRGHGFSAMTGGRPDMVWCGVSAVDFEEQMARSLQESMRDAVREAAGLPAIGDACRWRRDSWREARDWFVSSYPLLGAVAADFRIVSDPSVVGRLGVEVAAVSPEMNEIYIHPNPPFWMGVEEWKFVLAHEFLHAALRHDRRREYRDHRLWNMACDYVINDWLTEMKIGSMPRFALYDQRFHGVRAEAVYDILCEEMGRNRKGMTRDLIYGDETWWDTLEGEQLDDRYRSALQRGLEYHRSQSRGTVPAGLVEEIHALSRPPIRWDVELARWFDEQFAPLEKHRSYGRISRRQSATPDIPRPAWRREEQRQEARIFGVLLDTSGSMDRPLLAAALGAIASYSQARDVGHVRVVFCDAAAYDQGVMSPEEIAGAVRVRGRGGTRLQPGIDLLDRDEKFPKEAPLLIITDGGCDRLNLRGRTHAYLLPWGSRLPFAPRGEVFRLKA